MEPVFLIDFGSTNTKVVAVDLKQPKILGVATAYTTIETDVVIGLKNALATLEAKIGKTKYQKTYAASSAAGGLRMIAVGLVPAFTQKAAKLACFGAGAKVIKGYAYGLTEADILEIDELKPDILLLAGGTDGGNQKNIIENAKMLATCQTAFPIIYAGNRNAAVESLKILASHEVYLCENVMQTFDKLNLEPVQAKIREIFLTQIIKAKGLDKIAQTITGDLIPTPSAMLNAMKLLATGSENESGLGELLAVDLGGATTDIYSIANGNPKTDSVLFKGFPEPFAKRTVEGDIGMRYSVRGIKEAVGTPVIAQMSGLDVQKVDELIDYLAVNTAVIPNNDELIALDITLANLATGVAVNRHVGTMEAVYTPLGKVFAQTGKDLSDIKTVILTGGALIHQTNLKNLQKQIIANDPHYLKPKKVTLYQDKNYILASMGLLSTAYPDVALKLMKKELIKHEATK